VIEVRDLTAENFVERDLILVKVHRAEENHAELLKVVELFGGRMVDDAEDTYLIEFTGDATALEMWCWTSLSGGIYWKGPKACNWRKRPPSHGKRNAGWRCRRWRSDGLMFSAN
jgi:hypothetical protein